MAECTDISAALAKLEKKIDACCNNRLTEADVNRIAKEAVKSSPAIAAVTGGLTSLVNQFTLSRANEIAQEATIKRLEVQVAASNAKSATALAKAGDAVKSAGEAVWKAGQANIKGGDAVARVAGLAGAVAGLLSLYATLQITFPQLNEQEARLTKLEVREIQTLSKAYEALDAGNQAKAIAKSAQASASNALDRAERAARSAAEALGNSIRALTLAQVSIGESNLAKRVANEGKQLAVKAINAASSVLAQIPGIRNIAVSAANAANSALGQIPTVDRNASEAKAIAISAAGTANSAISQIAPVRQTASDAKAIAIGASGTANSAISQIPPIRQTASDAKALAQGAMGAAASALEQIPPVRQAASRAEVKADSALGQLPAIRALASDAKAIASRAESKADAASASATATLQRFKDAVSKLNTLETDTVPRIVRKVEQNTDKTRQVEAKSKDAQKTALHTVSIVNIAYDKLEKVSRQVYTTTGTVSLKDPAIVQIKNEIKRVESKQVNKDELKTVITETIKPDTFSDAVKVGVAASLPLLISASQKGLQQSLPAIETAAAAGVCKTTRPGGCMANSLGDLGNGLSGKMGNLLDGYNAATNTAQLALLAPMQRTLNRVDTNTRGLRGLITNGFAKVDNLRKLVTDKFGALYNALGIDRLVQLLTLASSLHNAAMLSNSLKDTILETTANVLAATGLAKDADGNPLDLNQLFGKQIEDFLKSVIGVQTYNNTKKLWIDSNRILSTAANLGNMMQSILHALIEGVEIVAGWVAKIGNGMKDEGIFNDRIYSWMNPNPNFKNPFLNYLQKAENLDDAASQINQLASTVLEIQQTSAEIKKQSADLQKQITDFNTTQTTVDAQKETESTPKTIADADLFKFISPQ